MRGGATTNHVLSQLTGGVVDGEVFGGAGVRGHVERADLLKVLIRLPVRPGRAVA